MALPGTRHRLCGEQGTAGWAGRATRAEISLDAIAHNVRQLKHHVSPSELLVVVKANGYGHGAIEVARTALANGADRLAVYTVQEGVVLRSTGVTAPTLVFGPCGLGEARVLVEHRLTPCVTTAEGAQVLQQASTGNRIGYHLKIDTGLTRSGIPLDEAEQVARRLRRFPALVPEGIFTHFASADEPDLTTTREQLRHFVAVCDQLRDSGYAYPVRHAANSAATLNLRESLLDMVRCGIAVYGYYPSPSVARVVTLLPALSLLSKVTRLHTVSRGTGVGYGHEFRCRRKSAIALVPAGYGDGLPRSLGCSAGRVIIRGQFAPIVGRMSMDQMTVDVTDVAGVQAGDQVTIIGQDGALMQSAQDLASAAGTISYDILAALLPRVPRLYVENGRLTGYSDLV